MSSCKGLAHGFSKAEVKDVHFDAEQNRWEWCDSPLCPNRYSKASGANYLDYLKAVPAQEELIVTEHQVSNPFKRKEEIPRNSPATSVIPLPKPRRTVSRTVTPKPSSPIPEEIRVRSPIEDLLCNSKPHAFSRLDKQDYHISEGTHGYSYHICVYPRCPHRYTDVPLSDPPFQPEDWKYEDIKVKQEEVIKSPTGEKFPDILGERKDIIHSRAKYTQEPQGLAMSFTTQKSASMVRFKTRQAESDSEESLVQRAIPLYKEYSCHLTHNPHSAH